MTLARLAVMTSGGDAPGMNAAIRAVTRKSIYEGIEVYGVHHGFAGLLGDEVVPMAVNSVADIIQRGGTILHTARSSRFMEPDGAQVGAEVLRRHGIEDLVVIGGDGSFRGALTLEALGVRVVGVPATIDNDLEGTDVAIGFDTAVNTVVEALDRIRDTATSHERTFVMEVMGRASGQIALTAGLAAGAESILVPEAPTELEAVVERLRHARDRGKRHSIILVAEGAGRGFEVGKAIETMTGMETRVTVLGHLQRGGNPSAQDRVLASRLGAAAVDALVAGTSGVMVGVRGQTLITTRLRDVLDAVRGIDVDMFGLAAILAI